MGRLLEDAGLRVVFKRFTDFEEQQDCIRRAAVRTTHTTGATLQIPWPCPAVRQCPPNAVLCCPVLRLCCLCCTARTQIVANIHYHDDAALEVHRINPLLAAGKCVLSEHSSDPELDALYSSSSSSSSSSAAAASSSSSSSAAEGPLGVVTFASYDEFVPEAVRLLASMTRREAMVSTARSLMWERHSGKSTIHLYKQTTAVIHLSIINLDQL
eukprot:COSAG06_NODE_5993_length_3163_cov_11.142298_3_plen_213_part_00